MDSYEKELILAKSIAKEAGEIMLRYFDADQEIEIKADNSQVTIADKLINTLVIERIAEAFPGDGVIGEEESTSEYGFGRKWFCDPIDGTAAYVWGVPTAMFSLALAVDGIPVVGVAYDPFLDRLYAGRVGQKSHCNDKEIAVSSLDFSSGIFAITSSVRSLLESRYFRRMVEDRVRFASFSGAVYKSCLVAKGKLIGYIEPGVNAHDMAAVHVILEGAGGKITAIDGGKLDYAKPFKGAIVSNGIVHEDILRYCA